jgi:hypothetical protein
MTEHSESPRKRIARCCCGSLRVETVGEPLIVGACFCEECQRRTGSATRYTRDGQEGRKVTFYFCPTRGSNVYWELPDRRPGQLVIAGGSFVDPDFPVPTLSIWEQSKQSWMSIPGSAHFAQNLTPPAPIDQ